MLPILNTLKIQTALFAAFALVAVLQLIQGNLPVARQARLLLYFLGLATVTIPLATNWFYALQFAYSFALIMIGYFAITCILQNERDVRIYLGWLVGIHIYLAIIGIRGYRQNTFTEKGYTSTGAVGGGFIGDENDLALALLVVLPLAIFLFRHARSLPGRILWGIGVVIILVTVVFTFSRGGFVGLAAMALYWVLTTKNRSKAIVTLAFAAIVVTAVAPSQYWARIETITDTEEGTAQLRRQYWAAARRMFLRSPIWGVGGNNTGVLMPDYAEEFREDKRPNQWGRVSHSLFYQLLAEFGALGILLMGAVLLRNFRDLRQITALGRAGRCPMSIAQLAACLKVSWVGLLVSALFLSILGYPHLYYLTALTVVVHRLARREENDRARADSVVPELGRGGLTLDPSRDPARPL